MGANESRESTKPEGGDSELSKGAVAAGTIAGLAAVALGVAGLVSDREERRKSTKQEGVDHELSKGAVAAGAIAGLAAVALGVAKHISGSSSSGGGGEKKTMKAPGRNNQRIYREDFERDPASYFKDLRK